MPQDITLIINSLAGEQIYKLDAGNLTVGRTELSDLILSDAGLSRRHTTFEQHDGEVWIFDENSTNGTFLNGKQINSEGARVFDGDEIRLGDNTRIFVQIRASANSLKPEVRNPKPENTANNGQRTTNNEQSRNNGQQTILIAAVVLSVFIISLTLIGIFVIAPRFESSNDTVKKTPTPVETDIGEGIIDPLKNEDPKVIDELLEAWEFQEPELTIEQVEDITSVEEPELTVKAVDWDKQRRKAREPRSAANIQPPPELAIGNIGKSLNVITSLGLDKQYPTDYVALAKLRLENKVAELPRATENYVLDQIGAYASTEDFIRFDKDKVIRTPVAKDSEDYAILIKLNEMFAKAGSKYDLNDGASRAHFKRRLHHMCNHKLKRFIEELAKGYREKFSYPLLITSLIRTVEYQHLLLSKTRWAAKNFRTGPHASGYTFDFAYQHMTAKEQEYLMSKLAEYERNKVIDAFFEGKNCIHVFIYPD